MAYKSILFFVLVFCSVLIDSIPYEQGNGNQAFRSANAPNGYQMNGNIPWQKDQQNGYNSQLNQNGLVQNQPIGLINGANNNIAPRLWNNERSYQPLQQQIYGKSYGKETNNPSVAYPNTQSVQGYPYYQPAVVPVTEQANKYNVLPSQSNQYNSPNLNNRNYVPWPVPAVQSPQVFGPNIPTEYSAPLRLPAVPVPASSLNNPQYGPVYKDQDKIVPTQSPVTEQPIYEKPYIIVHENGTYENVDNLNNIEWDEYGRAHLKTKESANLIIAIIEIEGVKKTEEQTTLEVPYDTGISRIPQDSKEATNSSVSPQSYNYPIVQTTTEDPMKYIKPEYLMAIQTTTENNPYSQINSNTNENIVTNTNSSPQHFAYKNDSPNKAVGYNTLDISVSSTPNTIVDTKMNTVTYSPLNAETIPYAKIEPYYAATTDIPNTKEKNLYKVNELTYAKQSVDSVNYNSYASTTTHNSVYNPGNILQHTTTDLNTYSYTTPSTVKFQNFQNADNDNSDLSYTPTTTVKTDLEQQDSETVTSKYPLNRHQLVQEKEPIANNDEYDVTRASDLPTPDAFNEQTVPQNGIYSPKYPYYKQVPNNNYEVNKPSYTDIDESNANNEEIKPQNDYNNPEHYRSKYANNNDYVSRSLNPSSDLSTPGSLDTQTYLPDTQNDSNDAGPLDYDSDQNTNNDYGITDQQVDSPTDVTNENEAPFSNTYNADADIFPDNESETNDTSETSSPISDVLIKDTALGNERNAPIDYEPVLRDPPRLRPDLEIDPADLKKVTDKEMVWFRQDKSFWDKVTKGDNAYDSLSVYNIKCQPMLIERRITVHHYENGTKNVEYVDSIWDSPDAPHPREVIARQVFQDVE